MFITRNAADRIRDLLNSFRLVMLGGVRQAGKTTLVEELLGFPRKEVFSFDDEALLSRATADPVGFVNALPQPAVVDEFQRAGEPFLLAVKRSVDRNRQRGQLLLTGSTNYSAARSVSETLPGRVGRQVLWPLSAGERRNVRETFIDRCLDPAAWPPPAADVLTRAELIDWMLEGSYPEVVSEGLAGRSRAQWFDAYVTDVISREALRPLAEIRLERELRQVFRLLAARTTGELVISDIARDAGLGRDTASDYVALLEALHVVVMIEPWATSAATRAKRRHKILLVDPGLTAFLTGAGPDTFALTADGRAAGALFETFILTEIHKQASWSEAFVDLLHFRDRHGNEIDLIIEDRQTGRVAGIEVKLSATPTARNAAQLARLRDQLGDRFTVGLVVHAGEHSIPLGDRLWAVPVPTLWRCD